MIEEGEEVNGFNIPLRELTAEEANRDISWERFKEFHYAAGEDFLDTTSEGNAYIMGGYLMGKYPKLSKEILSVCNGRYPSIIDFREIGPFGYDEGMDIDAIYAEFCNLTKALKKRVNQVLIQVTEHYA